MLVVTRSPAYSATLHLAHHRSGPRLVLTHAPTMGNFQSPTASSELDAASFGDLRIVERRRANARVTCVTGCPRASGGTCTGYRFDLSVTWSAGSEARVGIALVLAWYDHAVAEFTSTWILVVVREETALVHFGFLFLVGSAVVLAETESFTETADLPIVNVDGLEDLVAAGFSSGRWWSFRELSSDDAWLTLKQRTVAALLLRMMMMMLMLNAYAGGW